MKIKKNFDYTTRSQYEYTIRFANEIKDEIAP